MVIQSVLAHFHHSECGQIAKADRMQTFDRGCQSLLLADCHLPEIARNVTRARYAARPRGMWRWSRLLPVHRLPAESGLCFTWRAVHALQDRHRIDIDIAG